MRLRDDEITRWLVEPLEVTLPISHRLRWRWLWSGWRVRGVTGSLRSATSGEGHAVGSRLAVVGSRCSAGEVSGGGLQWSAVVCSGREAVSGQPVEWAGLLQ